MLGERDGAAESTIQQEKQSTMAVSKIWVFAESDGEPVDLHQVAGTWIRRAS